MAKPIVTLGVFKILSLIPKFISDPLNTHTHLTYKYGDLIRFKIKKNVMYLVNSPQYIKHILKDNPDNYNRKKALLPLSEFLGEGLFFSENKLWEQQHKLLRPAFHGELLHTYTSTLHRLTNKFCDLWSQNSSKLNLEEELKELMLNIQLETQFIKEGGEDLKQIIKKLDDIHTYTSFRGQVDRYIGSLFSYENKAKKSKYKAALAYLDDYAYNIIKLVEEGKKEPGVSLKLMIEAKQKGLIDSKQIRDELMNFLFAGFDTVAATLFWTFYECAKKQGIQDKIIAELKTLDSLPTHENLSKLNYTKMVVQEGLRKYPAAWSFHRVANEKDMLGEFEIPKKAYLTMSPFLVHRHKDYWNNPEEFNPDRFDGTEKLGHPFAYIPFGQGKRICIGNRLAMIQMQMIIPIVLEKYKVELVNNKTPKIVPGIIIKSKKPVYFKLTERKG